VIYNILYVRGLSVQEAQARVEALRTEAEAAHAELEDLKAQDQLLDLKLSRLSKSFVFLIDQRIADSKEYIEGLKKEASAPHGRSTNAKLASMHDYGPILIDMSLHGDVEAPGDAAAPEAPPASSDASTYATSSSLHGAHSMRTSISSSSSSNISSSRNSSCSREGVEETTRSAFMDSFEYATPESLAYLPEVRWC
jgi:hypothetical protein